ncbi:MAG: nitroreductase family protein [Bacteroidales bacterium]|jgi:nitroreductase|nr:nitroreductase family protein [Bacteroidales bacterium]
MEVLNSILTRRSIRKYTDETISREKMEELIRYGMYAPSAHNRQPWHFVLLNDKNVCEKILEFHPYAKMLSSAQWGIAVCGDETEALSPEYWPVDCGAATMNILLAAHGMGYGAVWLGIYPREERISAMQELLGLPPHVHTFSIISVGVPYQETATPDRFRRGRIHLNKW